MLLMFLSFLTDKKRSKTILYMCFLYFRSLCHIFYVRKIPVDGIKSTSTIYENLLCDDYSFSSVYCVFKYTRLYFGEKERSMGKLKTSCLNDFCHYQKIMGNFAEKIESGNPVVYILAFLIGVFVAIVEFPCSGQAFVAWTAIVVDRTAHLFLFNVLLFVYVLFFRYAAHYHQLYWVTGKEFKCYF